jgi:single-stranded-DNA-specific exonuclease
MINKWNYSHLNTEQEQQKNKLAEELNINPVLAQLLLQRGITTFDEAKKFFRPQLEDLHDPFLFRDMQKAVERLNSAMVRKEKILIYGDYDVDGTTAVALVYMFLRQSYSSVGYYIPDRYGEGYGISYKGIDYAAENDYSLVIALDCGIKAVEKIEYATNKGVDFIICDHHTPDANLPKAVAVLDPKRTDSVYPYSHLSGCGVGFKFMQAFAQSNNIPFSQLIPFLDLVAVSVASDIVPITGENRVLAYYGLKQINSNPSLGLKSIIDLSGISGKEIQISDIVFKIGPRINASGRMQSGNEAVELLIAKDSSFAKEKSNTIDEYNDERKSLDKNITKEADDFIKNDKELENKKSIVVFNSEWHKGVIGIVASRLSEMYYRPTVVLTESNGMATGSARSVPGFDLYKAIDACRHLLENFGGHMYAAGLSMKVENVEEFRRTFEAYVAENILYEQTYSQIEIDAILEFSDITPKFIRVLKQFSPFGPDNMKPVFCTKRVFDKGTSRLVGREMEHLKLELEDKNSEITMSGIAFGKSEFYDEIRNGKPMDICYTIEENTFNGNTSTQLQIKDIKIVPIYEE